MRTTTTTCTCCRGPRCVRVRSLDEISFDAALRRLRDELAVDRPPVDRLPVDRLAVTRPPSTRPSADGTHDAPLRPWEMTRRQFEAAAEPSVEFNPGWGRVQFRGLSRSVLRHAVELVLRCPGAPDDGYRVRVPARRGDLYDQPHRAFVEAALADDLAVPSSVLDEYPELRDAPPAADARPRLHAA